MYCRILHYRARNVARGVNKLFTSFGVLPGRKKVYSQQNTQRRFLHSKTPNDVDAERDCATPV
jgi:hypothetical protein